MDLQQLTRRVEDLESRLGRVETYVGLRREFVPSDPPRRPTAPPPSPRVAPPPPPPPPPAPPPVPKPAEEPTCAFPIIPAQVTPHPSTSPLPHPLPPTPRVSLEARIGKNLAGWVGAIVLVLGVGFFLKYAWQHEWIHPSPLGRVIFAALAGVGLGGIGEWLYRKPMRGLAAVLYGAGVAVTMTAFFAAHAYFTPPVLGPASAAAFVCLTAAGGIALALRADLPAMAILSLLGAYLSPIVLRSGADQSGTLIAYLLTLAAVGWTLCLVRPKWTSLRAFTFAASCAGYALWYVTVGQRAGHTALAMTYLATIYAGTLAELYLTSPRHPRPEPAAVLSLLNSLLTAVGLYVLYRTNQPLVGALLLGMAAIQAMVALSAASRPLRYSAVLQSTALVTLAVPLLLNQFAINLAWLVMGVALAILSRRLNLRWARAWAAALWLLAVGKLVTIDLLNPALHRVVATAGAQPLTRWLLMAWGAAVAAHALAFLGRPGTGKDRRGATLAAAGTILFLAATAAAWNAGSVWTLSALLWLTALVGLRQQGGRIGYASHANALLVLLAAKWLLFDGLSGTATAWSAASSDLRPIASLATLNGVLLCGLFTWVRSMTQTRNGRMLAAAAVGIIAFAQANFETCRTVNYLGHGWTTHELTNVKQLALCWLWAAAAMLLGTADALRPAGRSGETRKAVRGVAVALLVVALGRTTLFASDPAMRAAIAHLGTHPLSRWLLMMAALSAATHVLAWLTSDRADREDPAAAALAGLGTLTCMAAVIGTWGFAPATTLAGLLWLAPIAALLNRGQRLDYTRHAWALAGALAAKWLVADGLLLAVAAYADPSADKYLPLLNLPTLCALLLAAAFYYLGRATDGRNTPATGTTPRTLAAGVLVALAFLLVNFEVLRAVNHFAANHTLADLKIAKQVSLSILWAITGLTAISLGFGRNLATARYAGLAALGVTLLKVLTVDMAGVETIWRILSFTAVGGLLLCVSFVYYKHLEGKEPVPHE